MTDVKLEDAERVAGEIEFFANVGTVSIEMEDELRLAAALLRKIPELQKEVHYLKQPFADIEKELTSEGLDTNIALNALCKRADGHRKHIRRLEQQLAESKVNVGTASMYVGKHRLAVTADWMKGWNACLEAISNKEDIGK